MSSHQKYPGYVSAFGDLRVSDWDYNLKVYKRVLSGGFYTHEGKWRKIRAFPNNFWNVETAKELIRYFVLNEKGWNREEALKHLTVRLLRENQLTTAAKQFHSSTYEIVTSCFPEWEVKAWELLTCPNAFWNSQANCIEACVWIAQKEGIAEDKQLFCQSFSAEMLRKYGTDEPMVRCGGLYGLATLAFPKWNLKPWDLKKIGKITDEMAIEAVRWLIDEKLSWSKQQVCDNISAEVFRENGLGSILQHGCGNSPIKALEMAYPGQYKRSMLKNAENPFKN